MASTQPRYPSSVPSLTLLTLPSDIKYLIFRHFLLLPARNNTIELSATDLGLSTTASNPEKHDFSKTPAIQNDPGGLLQPQILRVCRQLHDECAELLYGSNTFEVSRIVSDDETRDLGSTFLRSLRPDGGLRYLRHVYLDMSAASEDVCLPVLIAFGLDPLGKKGRRGSLGRALGLGALMGGKAKVVFERLELFEVRCSESLVYEKRTALESIWKMEGFEHTYAKVRKMRERLCVKEAGEEKLRRGRCRTMDDRYLMEIKVSEAVTWYFMPVYTKEGFRIRPGKEVYQKKLIKCCTVQVSRKGTTLEPKLGDAESMRRAWTVTREAHFSPKEYTGEVKHKRLLAAIDMEEEEVDEMSVCDCRWCRREREASPTS